MHNEMSRTNSIVLKSIDVEEKLGIFFASKDILPSNTNRNISNISTGGDMKSKYLINIMRNIKNRTSKSIFFIIYKSIIAR